MGDVTNSSEEIQPVPMSLQICPLCRERAFTWHIDEDLSPLTQWHCSLCDYRAEEDESQESECDCCGGERSCVSLSDGLRAYWFCFACHSLRSACEDSRHADAGGQYSADTKPTIS